MVEVILVAIIGIYAGYVIIKKVKDMKKGKFCCNCSGCPSKSKCHKE